jgi:nitrogen fixation/metabolism regulation signal transduction histidine kinase
MKIFLFWLLAIILVIAGYLAFLWWHPRRRSHFQVRLTAIFLLFSLIPTVPLIFLASTLATNTADVLLVPEVETAMLQAVAALKAQCEDTGKRFAQAFAGDSIAPEALVDWNIDYCFVWQRVGEKFQLTVSHSLDEATHRLGLKFDEERVREVWGQSGSELEEIPPDSAAPAESAAAGHCRAWLPRGVNEMVILGYHIAPEVFPAKARLTQTMRIYNSLTLIKEKALQDQLIWGAAAAIILVLSLLSVFMARSWSRRLSLPIEDLIGVTAKVADGDLAAQARTHAKDEIGQLVDAFNKMIRDLRFNRERLIAAERLAAWREVARQVSHEIKNPLTPIQLALYRVRQKLGETTLSQPALQESFQSIEEELSSLRHLAEEFSAFARLPKAQLQPENLNEIIQLTIRLYETGNDNVRFELDLDPELPLRPLDREQIKRLLNNLIKNAEEAAHPQPCAVAITTGVKGERIVLEISDNGPGLTPEMQAQLFQPNFTTKRGGSGLGLVMIKRIVEEHGGAITVESQAGQGTRFRISI